MLLALDKLTNESIRAIAKKQTAVCPCCKEEVISKVGTIVQPHWSHKVGTECDSWAEPMTAWHIGWQEAFAKVHGLGCLENVLTAEDGSKHRSDISVVTEAGRFFVEVQHSSISSEEVAQREAFYGSQGTLVWFVDTRDWSDKFVNKWDSGVYWLTCRCRPCFADVKHLILHNGEDLLYAFQKPKRAGRRAYQGFTLDREAFISNPLSEIARVTAQETARLIDVSERKRQAHEEARKRMQPVNW